MHDPTGLIRWQTDVDPAGAGARVLLVALSGFFDAGSAQGLLVEHLLDQVDHRVVVTFNADELIDYRSRRPVMTYAADHWSAYDDPTLAIYQLHDERGTPFLLLAGPEPNLRWEPVVEGVRRLITFLGVQEVISIHGIPMAVPHTRPVGWSFHATLPERRTGHQPVFGTVQVPGSLGALLELRLGEAGHDAYGYAIHVPHYLAQSAYPPAAVAALRCLVSETGLRLPGAALDEAAARTMELIASEVEGSTTAAELVATLERQFDARVREPAPDRLLDVEGQVPTADELAAEFEAFLREENGR